MSKPGKARYRLEHVKQQFDEALDAEDGLVEFETASGAVFTITHPVFWDDELNRAAQAAMRVSSEATVTTLLGNEQAVRFFSNPEDTPERAQEIKDDVQAVGFLLTALRAEAQEKASEVRISRS